MDNRPIHALMAVALLAASMPSSARADDPAALDREAVPEPVKRGTSGVPGHADGPADEYQGPAATLPVRLTVPKGWKAKASKGKVDVYHQVRLAGPRNPPDTYTAHIIVRAFPILDVPDDIVVDVDAYVSQWIANLPAGATLSPRGFRLVAGKPAHEFSAVFPIPTIHHVSRHPGPTPVKTRMIIQARPPFLYELIYAADEREYPKYVHLFDSILDSIQFSE